MKVLLAADSDVDRRRGRELLSKLVSQTPDEPELVRMEAGVLLDEGTPEAEAQARTKLLRAVELNPSDAAAYLLLVNLARKQGEHDEARTLVFQGLSANPTSVSLQVARIAVEADLGAGRAARELAQRVLDQNPTDAALAVQVTDIFRRAGDSESTALFADRAIAIAPNDEYANIAKATAMAMKGDRKAGVAYLQDYTAREPGSGSVAAHVALASIATRDRDFATAEAALGRATAIAPGDAGVTRERLRLLGVQERYDEALEVLSEVRADHADDAATLTAGAYALAASSDPRLLREARSTFEAAAAADPRHTEAHRGLANVAYRMGDVDATLAAYRRLLEHRTDDAGAMNDLAWILAHDKGRAGLAEAEQIAARGVARFANDVHLLDTHGVILFKLGRLDDAKRALERCRALADPSSSTRAAAALHLAQVLMAQRADAGAIRALADEARQIDRTTKSLSDEDRAALSTMPGG
jgi:tetratricopeptide (TPR) repeat protein